jgi:hypothetical protein
MGRRKNVIAPEAKTMDLVAQKKDENLSAVKQIFSRLGILGVEYDLFLYIQTGKHLKGLHGNTAIALGAVLLEIREREKHGAYYKALEQIDIPPRTASRYIHIAKRYGQSNRPDLADLTPAKFDVIDMLSDPELEKLIAGEEVKGLTLDAIDELPATEARKRLRAAEKKLADQKERLKEVHGKEVEKLTEIISDLRIRAEDPMQLTPAQKAARELRTFTADYSIALAKISGGFREAMSILDEGEKLPGIGVQELNAWLNEFVPDSATIRDLFGQWDAGFENPSPIVDNFDDIIKGRVNV